MTKIGSTPLIAGVAYQNQTALTSLLEGSKPNLESLIPFNNSTALDVACFLSTTAIVRMLLDAGASATHVNDVGGNKIHGKARADPLFSKYLCLS